jgi:hypothetical protein
VEPNIDTKWRAGTHEDVKRGFKAPTVLGLVGFFVDEAAV